MFAIFSILMIFPIQLNHTISVLSDWSFHASRVEQIFTNLKNGNPFTYIATTTFGKVGSGSFLFYPSILLYPWAFLRFLFSPITSFIIFVCFLFFLTFLISFFCMLSFSNKNYVQSLIFSVVYTIAPYHLYLGIGNYVLGEFIAYTFLPLVFLGVFNIIFGNDKKWRTLAVGMTFILYSHFASAFITCEIIFLIFLITLFINKGIQKKRIITILKTIFITVLLASFILVPFFTDYIGHNVTSVAKGIPILFGADTFVTSSLTNNASNTGGLGLVLLFTAFFGWIWTKNKKIEIFAYSLGIFLSIIVTSIVPWKLLQNSPLAAMQFPYRYTSYAIFFLSIVLSSSLSRLLSRFNVNWLNYYQLSCLKIAGILFIGLFLYLGSSTDIILRNNGTMTTNNNILTKTNSNKLKSAYTPTSTSILNNKNYNYQFDYTVLYGETDYYPHKSVSHSKEILKHTALINGKKVEVNPIPRPNKLSYNIKTRKKSSIDLPTIAYNNTKITVNGKNHPFTSSNRGTVKLNAPQGKYKISVYYQPSRAYFIAFYIAIFTWILFIFTIFKKQASH